jgi:hypothetical protein
MKKKLFKIPILSIFFAAGILLSNRAAADSCGVDLALYANPDFCISTDNIYCIYHKNYISDPILYESYRANGAACGGPAKCDGAGEGIPYSDCGASFPGVKCCAGSGFTTGNLEDTEEKTSSITGGAIFTTKDCCGTMRYTTVKCDSGYYRSGDTCQPCPNTCGFGTAASPSNNTGGIETCYIPAGSSSDSYGSFTWSQMNYQ